MIAAVILLFGFLFCLTRLRTKDQGKEPPAAYNIPLIGCLPVLVSQNMGKGFLRMGKKHGPVVRTTLGFSKYIVLNGVDAMKTGFKNPALSGRPFLLSTKFLPKNGLIWWDDVKEQRGFFLKNAKLFEFSGNASEERVQREATILLDRLATYEGKAIDVRHTFNAATLTSVVSIIASSNQLKQSDPNIQDFVERSTVFTELPNPIMRACFFYPSLTTFLPAFISGEKYMSSLFTEAAALVRQYIQAHLANRKPFKPRDFGDALVDKIEATNDVSSVFHPSQDAAVPIILDVVMAGLETTSSVLEWTVLFLSQFPECQEKLFSEIDKTVGQGRLPCLSDRPSMPYCQAVLQEVLRMAPPIPIALHKATEDTQLQGYSIKKGTCIIGNYYGIHMDPDLWDRPEDFSPERFLDERGDYVKSDLLFTFGYGRRSCLGESMARDQMFLFVTQLVQRFQILTDKKLKTFEGSMAFGFHCVEFKAKFVPRMK